MQTDRLDVRIDQPSVDPVVRSVRTDPINWLYDTTQTIPITQEAPWDEPGEELLRSWLSTAKQQTTAHRQRGFKLKRYYKSLGILSIFTAAIVFLISNVHISDNDNTETFVRVFVAFVNLVIANSVNFLGYGPKYQRQFEYEGLYAKIVVDMEEILCTDRDFRVAKDRVLAEYKEKIGNLYTTAPEV
jgi:hypothetical protein